jgi:hypothetical protein
MMSHEFHEYMRSFFGDYITWYTFFVTINFVVAGWFAGKVLSRKPVSALGVWVTSGYFIIQGVLSVTGTIVMRSWYGKVGGLLLRQPDMTAPVDQESVRVLVQTYQLVFLLFAISLVSLLAFWLVVIRAAYYPRHTEQFFGQFRHRDNVEGSD